LQQTIILGGTMNTGKETTTRTLPAIAVRVIAAK
jgi:signal recognition particle receptor subunit beta